MKMDVGPGDAEVSPCIERGVYQGPEVPRCWVSGREAKGRLARKGADRLNDA